jgi:cell division inhibitor SepF
VRRTVQSFEDVRRAVDGLREGTQQIVNLEQTPSDMAERLIDFVNGATYAIDGSVEKIGEHVYLFTPPTVTIDVEDRAQPGAKTPFFDKT